MRLKNVLFPVLAISAITTAGCSKERLIGTYESKHKTSDNRKLIMIGGQWYQTKGVDTDFLKEGVNYDFELTKPLFFDRYISGFKPLTEKLELPENLI